MYPDHSSNNEAAEIQRRCRCCGHQELAHGAGHRLIIYSTHWCCHVYVLMLPPKRRIVSEKRTCSVHPPDDLPRKKSPQMYKPPTPEMLAYLDFSVSTTGILAGVKVCFNVEGHMSHLGTYWGVVVMLGLGTMLGTSLCSC